MWNKLFTLLAATLSVANALIKDCDISSQFKLTDLALYPDPPNVGDNVYMTVIFHNPGPEIIDGKAVTSVTWNGIPLTPTTKPLCSETTECPLLVGINNRSTMSVWPSGVTGKVNSKIQWFDIQGKSLLCIQSSVSVAADYSKSLAPFEMFLGQDKHYHPLTPPTPHHSDKPEPNPAPPAPKPEPKPEPQPPQPAPHHSDKPHPAPPAPVPRHSDKPQPGPHHSDNPNSSPVPHHSDGPKPAPKPAPPHNTNGPHPAPKPGPNHSDQPRPKHTDKPGHSDGPKPAPHHSDVPGNHKPKPGHSDKPYPHPSSGPGKKTPSPAPQPSSSTTSSGTTSSGTTGSGTQPSSSGTTGGTTGGPTGTSVTGGSGTTINIYIKNIIRALRGGSTTSSDSSGTTSSSSSGTTSSSTTGSGATPTSAARLLRHVGPSKRKV